MRNPSASPPAAAGNTAEAAAGTAVAGNIAEAAAAVQVGRTAVMDTGSVGNLVYLEASPCMRLQEVRQRRRQQWPP